jgi:hypothetical protein
MTIGRRAQAVFTGRRGTAARSTARRIQPFGLQPRPT